GKAVTGRGADTDTMVASARAYVSALNKLAIKRNQLHAQAEASASA
ncbi:MAG: alpha-isopropylmalate synthase regulatory domain-containing protein, partial [Rhodomicrobium sp.]